VNGAGFGAVEHQYVDQIGMVYAGRDVKRRLLIRGFRIHICPVPQKKMDNIREAPLYCKGDRRQICFACKIHVCFVTDQCSDSFEMTVHRVFIAEDATVDGPPCSEY
jgi:hypothetical protein